MKTKSPTNVGLRPSGFALVVTLTLMVLLTILSLGLLSLATVTTRNTGNSSAEQIARANARMALSLAIGRLQTELGPDARINFPSGQLGGTDASSIEVAAGRHHWIGVSDSWNSVAEQDRPEAADLFRRWLVSGMEPLTENRDSVFSPADADEVVLFEGENQEDKQRVSVPKVTVSTHANGTPSARYAWWIGDENSKALVKQAGDGSAPASVWSNLQSPSSTGYDLTDEFAGVDRTGSKLSLVASADTFDLVTGKSGTSIRGFHDFTDFSRGLMTDSAQGGLRKDLSLFLDHPKTSGELPTKLPNTDRLYSDGITWEELWLYHNVWQALQEPVDGLASMTGGSLAGAQMLVTPPGTGIESAKAFTRDPFSIYKSIRHIRKQWISSLWAKENAATDPNDPETYQICWVSDPSITIWNPFDVPMALHPDAYYSIKFWTIPYNIKIYKDGALVVNKSFHSLSTTDNNRYIFSIIAGTARSPYYGRTGTPDPVVLMPGEVLIMSEGRQGEPRAFFEGNAERSIAMKAGWNLGRGRYVPIPGLENIGANEMLEIELGPDNSSLNNDVGFGQRLFSYPYSYGRDRRGEPNVKDFVELWGTKIYSPPDKKATSYPDIFPSFSKRRLPPPTHFTGNDKELILSLSLQNRTEDSATSWNRFYSASTAKEFLMLEDSRNLATHPLEADIRQLSGLIDPNMPQSGATHPNRGLFGGSFYNHEKGQDIIITNAIPREPPISLGAFQNALANGNTERMAGGALNPAATLPAPEVTHAISNSYALPIIAADKISNPANGTRRFEQDHSWQVNRMLWDSWFLSGIVQQQAAVHTEKKTAVETFTEFAESGGEEKLLNQNFLPYFDDADEATDTLFASSGAANDDAHEKSAALLMMDGAFNVNSTSVAAWESILGSLNREVIPVAPNPNQPGGISNEEAEGTPVGGIQAGFGTSGTDSASFTDSIVRTAKDSTQWHGYRELTDAEITELAQALVEEIKTRGPFLSLSDFINRRVGTDREMALRGPLQAALDKTVNKAFFDSADRIGGSISGVSFDFSDAAELPKTIGSPAHVMQADLLTAIGPQLTVHSDTFRIRAYGEALDKSGNVTAKAWCEATVQRVPDYLDPTDAPDQIPSVSSPNVLYGRAFHMRSFRWLNAEELNKQP